MQVMKVMKLNF